MASARVKGIDTSTRKFTYCKKAINAYRKKTPRSKLKTVTICTRIASKTYTHRVFLIKAKKGEINEIAY